LLLGAAHVGDTTLAPSRAKTLAEALAMPDPAPVNDRHFALKNAHRWNPSPVVGYGTFCQYVTSWSLRV
jgi:hypothetical protein